MVFGRRKSFVILDNITNFLLLLSFDAANSMRWIQQKKKKQLARLFGALQALSAKAIEPKPERKFEWIKIQMWLRVYFDVSWEW